MAKRKILKRKKGDSAHGIDHIPKYSQQRRSPGCPKRRTDFSIFFCSSSSSSSPNARPRQGLLLDSVSCKDMLSSVSIANLDDTRDKRKEMLELPPFQHKQSQDKSQGLLSNIVEVPVLDVESDAQNAVFEHWDSRNAVQQRSDMVKTIEFNPDKSQITVSNEVCVAPGTVVWAKTAHHVWWPAEILGERSVFVDSSSPGIDGHVLIQYYGSHESAWVDPASELSQFEACFEERSCNPMEEFQDALKQALHQKEHLSLCRLSTESLDGPDCSNQQDRSPDKWNSSSSSRTDSDCLRTRRGKRERKPKVRFDEVIFPLKSARKVRRFRIMRFLGLAAPIGSPF